MAKLWQLRGGEGQEIRMDLRVAPHRLCPVYDRRIRVVPPAYLVATKLEAFGDRGDDDCLASRDFEDIILLVDSREELLAELEAAPNELRDYVKAEVGRVMRAPNFDYGVEGALTGPGARDRAAAVTIPRLRLLAGCQGRSKTRPLEG